MVATGGLLMVATGISTYVKFMCQSNSHTSSLINFQIKVKSQQMFKGGGHSYFNVIMRLFSSVHGP